MVYSLSLRSRAVVYSAGRGPWSPSGPTVLHEEKKPRSCHGSWTDAGMHITKLERETGWLGGGSRGGEVVKLFPATRTALNLYEQDHIKEQIRTWNEKRQKYDKHKN